MFKDAKMANFTTVVYYAASGEMKSSGAGKVKLHRYLHIFLMSFPSFGNTSDFMTSSNSTPS